MSIYDDKQFIGKKIKQLRKNAKMSQAELSEKIGMTEKNLSNIERGLQLPALNSFFKMLEIMNIPLYEFGVNSSNNENLKRDELIKEIYLSDQKELEAFLTIIKTLKSLR